MEHKVDGDIDCSWCTQNHLKGLVKGLENLEIRGQVETIQTTALLKSARILRRSWRLEETCCHSKFNGKPSAVVGIRNSNNNNNNNNTNED